MPPVSAQQPAESREHPSPGDSVFRDSGARRVTTSFRAVGKVPAGRVDRAAHLRHRPSRPGYGGPAVRDPAAGRGGRARPGVCAARPRLSKGGSRHGGWTAPSSSRPLRDAHGRTPGIPGAGGGGGGGGRMPATVPGIYLPRPAPGHGDERREHHTHLSPIIKEPLTRSPRTGPRGTGSRGGALAALPGWGPARLRCAPTSRRGGSPPSPRSRPSPRARGRRGRAGGWGRGAVRGEREEPVIGLLTINRHDPRRGGPYQAEGAHAGEALPGAAAARRERREGRGGR